MDFVYKNKAIKEVGFFGFGKSNKALYEYLKKRYPILSFTLRDECTVNSQEGFSQIFTKKNAYDKIRENVLFLSPSVRRDSPFLSEALKRGVIISSDIEFFFERKSSDVYAVTGSDGKSTTAYLTSKLMRGAYKDAIPIANFGEPVSSHIEDGRDKALIAELSSFQLEYYVPKTKRCVITNITPNHLNWHKSLEEYVSAKENILRGAQEHVFNYDCERSRTLMTRHEAHTVVSALLSEEELKKTVYAKRYITLNDGHITVSGERFLDTSRILARGTHNIYNFMFALALAYENTRKEDLLSLAESFTGLNHRFETVHISGGIKYIDSSIDSSPKRTLATLTMTKEKVILILGGRSKSLSFEELVRPISEKAKAVILVGENGKEIEEVLKSSANFTASGTPYKRFSDFYEGVNYAVSIAKEGDTVLLSPASTSFDAFSSFEERGDAFKKSVKEITGAQK